MPFARPEYDAVVVGSGPNGLAAAITVAQAGRSVLLIEGEATVGGGARSAELTLPGFMHDVCSAVHPMALWSPFFRQLPLRQYGLEWIHPAAPLAHPLDDGSAVTLDRSAESTAQGLGDDRKRYLRLMEPLIADWPNLESTIVHPFGFPSHPLAAMRFALDALRPASGIAKHSFRHDAGARAFCRARGALHAAAGTRAERRLRPGSGSDGAHGGLALRSRRLAEYCERAGRVSEITWRRDCHGRAGCGDRGASARARDFVRRDAAATLTAGGLSAHAGLPRQIGALSIWSRGLQARLGAEWPHSLEGHRVRARRYGSPGGTFEEIAASERAPFEGDHSEKPFVLLAQPTLFDQTRAPAGKHIAWGYCHVPNGSAVDMTAAIENQIERFAPGFRALILKRSVRVAASLEGYNPNLIGGDIGGGMMDLGQFLRRPTRRLYRTPAKGIYLCSSSTPPGPGVHGLCGHLAARAALKDLS